MSFIKLSGYAGLLATCFVWSGEFFLHYSPNILNIEWSFDFLAAVPTQNLKIGHFTCFAWYSSILYRILSFLSNATMSWRKNSKIIFCYCNYWIWLWCDMDSESWFHWSNYSHERSSRSRGVSGDWNSLFFLFWKSITSSEISHIYCFWALDIPYINWQNELSKIYDYILPYCITIYDVCYTCYSDSWEIYSSYCTQSCTLHTLRLVTLPPT